MATAATSAVYNQVFKKKIADAVRVGMGGGLCFCGINMYFKNEKFYDDWVMPLFKRMEPETAHVMAMKAAKYNLVPVSKLEESRLLVSTQPKASSKIDVDSESLSEQESDRDAKSLDRFEREFDGASEELMSPPYKTTDELAFSSDLQDPHRVYDSEFEPDDTCPGICIEDSSDISRDSIGCDSKSFGSDYSSSCNSIVKFPNGEPRTNGIIRKSYLNEISHYRNDLRACESPKSERNCVTPDSPSLSMRVNIASPLRSSKMSLATVVDGSNPAYDQDRVEEIELGDKVDLECNCQIEECIVSCKYDDGSRTDIVHIINNTEGGCRCARSAGLAVPTVAEQCNLTGPIASV